LFALPHRYSKQILSAPELFGIARDYIAANRTVFIATDEKVSTALLSF